MIFGTDEKQIEKEIENVLFKNKFLDFAARDAGLSSDEFRELLEKRKKGGIGSLGFSGRQLFRPDFKSVGAPSQKEPEVLEEVGDPEPWPEEKPEEKPIYQVSLSNGTFEKKNGAFEFTKPCTVKVKAQLPENCPNRKVEFKLFSVYENNTMDHQHSACGYIDEEGQASAELKLFYNSAYYKIRKSKPDAKVEYYFTASHKDVSEPVESKRLQMPLVGNSLYLELVDESDNALAGVKCNIYRNNELFKEIESDSKGIVSCDDVPEGNYQLEIAAIQ